jgi:PKD repeat protein
VTAGSILKGGAPDGTDIGADFTLLATKTRRVVEGVMDGEDPYKDPSVAPSADFTVACTLLTCTFTDHSIAGTQPIATRSWNFGDGTVVTGPGGAHTFAAAGSYTVTLTVADANGLSGTVSKVVTADAPLPPLANLQVACQYLECTFTDVSTAGSGAIVARAWTFGDGTPVLNDATTGLHVYTAAGTYQVALLVTDANGLSAAVSTQVTVEPPNVAPVAAFTSICVDLTCAFTDTSTDVDGHVAGWAWSFGAGASTASSPTFSFAAPGSYTVTLVVTDDDGAQAAVAVPVQVNGVLHAYYTGSTLKWSSASGSTNYWSADVTVAIHGANERLVPGATVTAAWTGAVVKTVTCVTNASGVCVLKSGTLSYLRSTVTLTVTSVTAPGSTFNPAANHDAARLTAGFTLNRP